MQFKVTNVLVRNETTIDVFLVSVPEPETALSALQLHRPVRELGDWTVGKVFTLSPASVISIVPKVKVINV